MVYLRVPNWKTAITNPSGKAFFDQKGNYTPLQKMMLTRNRIWGNIVGTNARSGYKELARPMKGPRVQARYEFSDLHIMYPFIKNWDKLNYSKEKYFERKMRIFMRGVKIGNAKANKLKVETVSIFEHTKKKVDTEEG